MHEPCKGGLGVSSHRRFSNLEASKCYFQHLCHEICLRKIDFEYENGKQLQVTIIKITESTENKSMQRLDVPGSTSPGEGAAAPLAPPLATALIGSQ